MKKILTLVLTLFFLFFPCLSFADFSGEFKASSNYYNVGGNTENSFYESESLEYLSELYLDLNEKISGDWCFKGSLNLRATDDQLVDPQDLSMGRFFVEFSDQDTSFTGGDFSANFSSLSLSSSLRGLKFSQGLGESLKFTAVTGANFSRWEDLWEERQEDSRSRQYIGGFRLEQEWESLGNLGLNFGASRDDDSYVSAYSDPQKTEVVSLDTKLSLLKDLNLEAEFATSWLDRNIDSKEIDKKTDHALHLAGDYRIGSLSFRAGFDRYGSNFSTAGGFVTQDLEEYFLENEINLPKDVRLRLSYRENRDNLDKHKSTTTFQKSPGINLSFRPLKNTNVDLGYDLTRRDATDDSVEEVTRRAFTRLHQGIGPAAISLEYQRTKIDDNIDNTRERLNDSVIFGFNTSFSLKNINFSPSLEYEVTHDEYRDIQESDLTQAYGLGLRVTFPKDWEINSRVRFSDFNSYQADADQLRTRYEFNLLKRLGENYEFSLNYEHSGYGYETSEENYSETLVNARLNFRF